MATLRTRLTVTYGAALIGGLIVFAVALNRVWAGQQARDQQIREARDQHLERIHTLLRSESDALRELADSLRSGRYFTQVANDSRQAVWRDEALTADIEHHFPDYFGEREQLIRTILQYDDTLGRLRQRVSESLHLSDWTDPYAIELVSALVKKCGGGYVPRTIPEESSARHPERVSKLILSGGSSQCKSNDEAKTMLAMMRSGWGDEDSIFFRALSAFFIPNGTADQRKSLIELQRAAFYPEAARCNSISDFL